MTILANLKNVSFKTSISQINFKYSQVLVYFCLIMIINYLVTSFVYSWATDDDITGLPSKDSSKMFDDRFISLFYFNIITFTTVGYGDMLPKSNRAKLFISVYVALVAAGLLTALEILI